MTKKILFVFRQLPQGSAKAQEALDILLMASTQQHIISVVFIDDGVWQLKTQQAEMIASKGKNFTAAYKALPLYDVTQIFVDKTSLQQRQLQPTELTTAATILDAPEIAALMQQQDIIYNF
jgi:tRNA 2-thiouridine synthesizing protein C